MRFVIRRHPCVGAPASTSAIFNLATLECEPRRWKIIEHVREKFSCRDCDSVTEPPAPSHPIPRGFAGPSLLAMVLVAKFLMHQPLNQIDGRSTGKPRRSA